MAESRMACLTRLAILTGPRDGESTARDIKLTSLDTTLKASIEATQQEMRDYPKKNAVGFDTYRQIGIYLATIPEGPPMGYSKWVEETRKMDHGVEMLKVMNRSTMAITISRLILWSPAPTLAPTEDGRGDLVLPDVEIYDLAQMAVPPPLP
eukprot:gene21319-28250_t